LGEKQQGDSKNHGRGDPHPTNTQHHQPFWTRWKRVSLPNKLTVVCTFIIAVATAIYANFAYRQWDVMSGQLSEMRNQAVLAQKSLVASQRASVHFGPVESFFDKDGRIVFHMPVENSGHVPSDGFYALVKVDLFKASRPFEMIGVSIGPPAVINIIGTFTLKFGGKITNIPPGRDYYSIKFPTTHAFSKEERSALEARLMWITMGGDIFYGDGFGTIEKSSFCFARDPDPRIGWHPCPLITSPASQPTEMEDAYKKQENEKKVPAKN
jgi:hypothetical protein